MIGYRAQHILTMALGGPVDSVDVAKRGRCSASSAHKAMSALRQRGLIEALPPTPNGLTPHAITPAGCDALATVDAPGRNAAWVLRSLTLAPALCTVSDIAGVSDLATSTIRHVMARLAADGLIEPTGEKRKTGYRKAVCWRITPEGRRRAPLETT